MLSSSFEILMEIVYSYITYCRIFALILYLYTREHTICMYTHFYVGLLRHKNLGGVQLAYSKTEGEILLYLCLIELTIQWHDIAVKYNSTSISCPFSLTISVLWFSWPKLPNCQTITKETFLQSWTPACPPFLSVTAFCACASTLSCECCGMPWCSIRVEWGLAGPCTRVLVFGALALAISNPSPGLTSLPQCSVLSPYRHHL